MEQAERGQTIRLESLTKKLKLQPNKKLEAKEGPRSFFLPAQANTDTFIG